MRAVVLVGGEGTRLRPITETIPKPLVPIMNRPFLHHVLDHLGRHGVHEVVLSSSYLEERFLPFLAERRGDPAVVWITEREPLGTGGAIVNALPHLGEGSFFVLNGDILTDLDLSAMLAFHRNRGSVATIALHHVEDARPYGLVPTEPDGRVVEFREKPDEPAPGDINAGTYVLEPAVLDAWKVGRSISIEREIYPDVIGRGEPVYGFLSEAYWLDLGTPERYLRAHFDILAGMFADLRDLPSPFRDETAVVDPRARIGKRVVLGEHAEVGAGAVVEDSVVHARVRIEEGARVVGSILGPGAVVGEGASVERCVLGEGAVVPPRERAADARVPAGRSPG
jgi:mannose-1-phosphate guanylyltransferase